MSYVDPMGLEGVGHWTYAPGPQRDVYYATQNGNLTLNFHAGLGGSIGYYMAGGAGEGGLAFDTKGTRCVYAKGCVATPVAGGFIGGASAQAGGSCGVGELSSGTHRLTGFKAMRRMKAPLRYALVGTAVALMGCDGIVDTQTNQYASYSEAMEAGAMQRGWLPQELPRSASSIMETHNIDTNEIWVRFQYAKPDIDAMLSQCVEGAGLRLTDNDRVRRMAPWWPDELTNKKKGNRLPSGVNAYRCPRMSHAQQQVDAGLILETKKAVAWYWVP